MDNSQSPVPCSTTRERAFLAQSGWLFPGTSQAKNRNATTMITSPRASPNTKPSVRSSAPTRLSRMASEIFTVTSETMSSVPRNSPPMAMPLATRSLLTYCFTKGTVREKP